MRLGVWRGQRVFVTGHLGFKGRWLVSTLRRLGASVVGYSLVPSDVSHVFPLMSDSGVVSNIGDILDYDKMKEVLSASKANIAFHLAAQPIVSISHQNPRATYMANVIGTVNFLQAVENTSSVQVAIVVTSDKVYRPRNDTKSHVEGDELGGFDPYSASKACAELVCRSYANRYSRMGDKQVATVRAGNVIGGGDWSLNRLVPDLSRALGTGRPVVIRSPSAVRPWQHVIDAITGYLSAARCLQEQTDCNGRSWNFGPTLDDSIMVGELARRFSHVWGSQLVIESNPEGYIKIPESQILTIDSSLAINELGWKRQHNIDSAIESCVESYKSVFSGNDVQVNINKQINQMLN